MKVLGVSGSLRNGSFNRKLLLDAAELRPGGVELELWDGLKSIPPFDEDDERFPPPSVVLMRDAFLAADAILFATPEYNHSLPGQLKNALDWASRPKADAALRGKPVAVIGASTGAFGAIWAQEELRKVLAAAGARVVDTELAVGRAATRFDEHGRLADDNLRDQLRDVLAALVAEAAVDRELASVA
jgi:chromate reductase